LFQPGTNFLPYWTQVDVSLRRLFRFNNIQASVQADLYNALNAAVQTDEVETYGGAWGRPTRLLQGRILRTAFQLNW